jgi:hypothetical protein
MTRKLIAAAALAWGTRSAFAAVNYAPRTVPAVETRLAGSPQSGAGAALSLPIDGSNWSLTAPAWTERGVAVAEPARIQAQASEGLVAASPATAARTPTAESAERIDIPAVGPAGPVAAALPTSSPAPRRSTPIRTPLSPEGLKGLSDRATLVFEGATAAAGPATKWKVVNTGLRDLDSIFIPAGLGRFSDYVVRRARKVPAGERMTIVDWGAGNGRALIELARALRGAGVPPDRVRLVGFGDVYFERWKAEAELGVEFILDRAENFPRYFKPGEIDVLFSYLGLYHMRQNPMFSRYMARDIAPLLDSRDGVLVMDYRGSTNDPDYAGLRETFAHVRPVEREGYLGESVALRRR